MDWKSRKIVVKGPEHLRDVEKGESRGSRFWMKMVGCSHPQAFNYCPRLQKSQGRDEKNVLLLLDPDWKHHW